LKYGERSVCPRFFIPKVDLDNADLHDDGKLPWWFNKKDNDAVTVNNDIYVVPGVYDPSTVEGLALIAHELVHVGQYRTGYLTRLKYLLEAARHGTGPTSKNKYEKPAYDKGDEVQQALDALKKKGVKCGCDKP
jgi:hypothetical protein